MITNGQWITLVNEVGRIRRYHTNPPQAFFCGMPISAAYSDRGVLEVKTADGPKKIYHDDFKPHGLFAQDKYAMHGICRMYNGASLAEVMRMFTFHRTTTLKQELKTLFKKA